MNSIKIFAKSLFESIYNKLIDAKLQFTYGENEVRNFAYILIEHITGASKTDIVINKELKISEDQQNFLNDAIKRISNHEPIQYIIGEVYFYGRKFQVNKDVLIPRRETEELVHLIINENQGQEIKLLDIGTGSGCIAITLNKEIKNSKVSAIDISETALKLAATNAQLHQAPVDFYQVDIFDNYFRKNEEEKLSRFDLIVSNPPYVRLAEAKEMHKNVMDYEPHLALFVADEDPLIFYKRIVLMIKENVATERNLLKAGGGIFFEVNENFAEEVALLLKKNNFCNIRIFKDLQQKNRFVSGNLEAA